MAQLRSYSFERVDTSNGVPISGAKAYVYDANTANLSSIFTDAAGLVPAANPIISDSAGIFPNRYFADGSYDIKYTDASDVQLGPTREDVVIDTSGGGGGGGGDTFDVIVKTNNFSVTAADVLDKIPVYLCDASGIPGLEMVVTADAGLLGIDKAFEVINTGATGTIRVQADAGETIDGAADVTLTGDGAGRGFVCIGAAGWRTIYVTNLQQNSLVIASAPAADQTNFTASGLGNSVAFKQIDLSPTASINFNSVAGITAGERLTIANVLDGSAAAGRLVILPHDHAASTVGNRFYFPDRMPRFLIPGKSISFIKSGNYLRPVDDDSFSKVFPVFTDGYQTGVYYDRTIGTNAFVTATPAAGAITGDTTQKPQGVIGLQTGTTTTGGASFGVTKATTSILVAPAQGQALYFTRVQIDDLSDATNEYSIRAGFTGIHADDTDVTNGVYWEYLRTAAVQWAMCCAGAASRSKTATGTTVAVNIFYWLGIYINGDWTQADFFLSTDGRTFTFPGSQTGANMPTSAETTEAGIILKKSAGTTGQNAYVDLQGHRYDTYRGA